MGESDTIHSWEKVYQEELTNFEEIGDEGEVWYSRRFPFIISLMHEQVWDGKRREDG